MKNIKNNHSIFVSEEQAEQKNKVDIDRRGFLKTCMASGISTAVFSSSSLMYGLMASRHADAQESNTPNKSVVVYVPGGGIHDLWAPEQNTNGLVMGLMSQQYDSIKEDCHFLKNMTHTNGGHGYMPLILSQGYNGDTYDVFMGAQLGASLPYSYINLGVHSNGHGVLTRAGSTQISFQDNPFNAFTLLYGDNSGSPNSSKDAILQAHTNAANAIKNKLAGYEVARLDEHIEAIAQTKDRLDDLANSGGGSCSAAPDNSVFPLTYETFTEQAKLQADIIVSALKCNMTRSCSLALGNHQGEFQIPELNYKGSYHQSIHGGSNGLPNYPYYVEMRAHLGGLSAYLIERLKIEGLLDTTIFAEVTDMGHGDLHGLNDVPMLLAGGGGAIHTGVATVGLGYSQHDMLHTAAKACGVELGYGKEVPGILNT